MKLNIIKLWKIDNYNTNLYNVFKWYLNLKKLYLVFYSIYNLDNFQLIYLYYYKFKKLRWVGNILKVFRKRNRKRKLKNKKIWPKKQFKIFKKNRNYLLPLAGPWKIYTHKNILTASEHINNKNLLIQPKPNLLLVNFRNLIIVNLLTFKRHRLFLTKLKKLWAKKIKIKNLMLEFSQNRLKKKLFKKINLAGWQPIFQKKIMPWEYRLNNKNFNKLLLKKIADLKKNKVWSKKLLVFFRAANLKKTPDYNLYRFLNFLNYTESNCDYLNLEFGNENFFEEEFENHRNYWLNKVNFVKKVYLFNWTDSHPRVDYFRWQTLKRVLSRRKQKRIRKIKKKLFTVKKRLNRSNYKRLERIRFKMLLKRRFPLFFSKPRIGFFKFSKRRRDNVRVRRIRRIRKRRFSLRQRRLRKYKWGISRRRMLKIKFNFLRYYLIRYLNSSVIIFRSIRKTNPNIKKLFARYFYFFWFFRKDKYFKDLVYSVILSKLFIVSDMLGYMIAKIFIDPKNQAKIMHQVKNFWEFFSFNVSLKLNIKGKWRGRPRAKERMLFIGNVKRQSNSEYLDYTYFPITTIYGVFSIKIWLNKQWN